MSTVLVVIHCVSASSFHWRALSGDYARVRVITRGLEGTHLYAANVSHRHCAAIVNSAPQNL